MFLEEELAEAQLQALRIEIALNLTPMADGDNPCFFGDHYRYRIAFLAQSQCRPVPQP